MANALSIITSALQTLGVAAIGQTINPEDASVSLTALNDLVDSWTNQTLFSQTTIETIYAMPGNAPTLTIGPGLQININRPMQLEDGIFMRKGNQDYPIEVIARVTYENIKYKSMQAFVPDFIYYDTDVTGGLLYFYPIMQGAGELHIPLQLQMTQFADLTTNYPLVQGYRRALQMTLAEELQEVFGKQLPPTFGRRAGMARKMLKRGNVVVPKTETPQPIRWNILNNR